MAIGHYKTDIKHSHVWRELVEVDSTIFLHCGIVVDPYLFVWVDRDNHRTYVGL